MGKSGEPAALREVSPALSRNCDPSGGNAPMESQDTSQSHPPDPCADRMGRHSLPGSAVRPAYASTQGSAVFGRSPLDDRKTSPVASHRFVSPLVLVLGIALAVTQLLPAQEIGGKAPKRIVSLSPSNTEILFAVGAGQEVVGVTTNDDYPEAVSSIAKVGPFDDINIERVVALEPDLVFASNIQIARVVPALRRLGLRVLVVDPATVDGVLAAIDTVGSAVGRKKAASSLVTSLRSQLDSLAAKTAGLTHPRVFWELSPDLWTAGPGSYVDDLIRLAGGVNIVGRAKAPWLQISSEAVVAADPQVVILSDAGYGASPESVARRPGWSSIAAVKSGRVIPVLNEDIVSRPGPRVVEALKWVAKVLHPGAF